MKENTFVIGRNQHRIEVLFDRVSKTNVKANRTGKLFQARETREIKTRFAIVLSIIGRESGASFSDQSYLKV